MRTQEFSQIIEVCLYIFYKHWSVTHLEALVFLGINVWLKNACARNLSWFCWSKPSRLNENLSKCRSTNCLILVWFYFYYLNSGSRGVKASTSEDRAHGRKKKREKKGGGYCECCMVKYENITMVRTFVKVKFLN